MMMFNNTYLLLAWTGVLRRCSLLLHME